MSTENTGETRYFQVSIQRLCGEFVCGRVSREFYDYWLEKDDSAALESHIRNIEYEDERDPDSPDVIRHGDPVNGWYEIDDIGHINNAVVHGNDIHVDEVKPDPDSWSGYAYTPDGYSAVFSFDDIIGEMPDGFINETREIAIDHYAEAPENPVLVAKSIEKGAQTIVVCQSNGPFDPKKLSFETWDFDGDTVIISVFYDGEELENQPDSSDGRAFYAYVGDLLSDPAVTDPDVDAVVIEPDLNAVPPVQSGKFRWMQIIATFLFLGLLIAEAIWLWL